MPPQPAPPSAAEVVLTFLESVGKRSEAEFYLKLFLKLPPESFAIIAPGGPVLRSALGSLGEQLRFLGDLGLFAPVVLGLFDPENAAASSERLIKRLPAIGLDACPHEMSEPGLVEKLRDELKMDRMPVVHFDARTPSTSQERLAALAELARALDTRKVVLLRRRGGIAARGDRPVELWPGHTLSAAEGRISVINLRTEGDALLASKRLPKSDSDLMRAASTLIQNVASNSLLVSVTSPLNLLKELFTVKGAGTLIKPGSPIERRDSYAETDTARIQKLLESSFGRPLVPDFFARPPLAVYFEAAYRGVAILHAEEPGPYLSKFAVEPEAQGEGIGQDLWQAMLRDFPRLFWRGRPDNPINSWYQSVCDGMLRAQHWTVFWRGIEPSAIPALVACAETLPQDFPPPGTVIEPAGAA